MALRAGLPSPRPCAEQVPHQVNQAIDLVSWANLVAFVALAVVALRQWRRRKEPTSAWAAAGFTTLGVVVLIGRILPEHPHALAERIVLRADIVVLLLFPFCLYRFTAAFDPASRRLTRVIGAMTAVLVLWTVALPRLPQSGQPRPHWFDAYLAAFLVHWTALSVIVALRLWRAGRGQPSVARRRMRLLGAAAGALTLALVFAVGSTEAHSPLALASGLLATLSAVAFLLGLAPPVLVRELWRRPEQQRLQDTIGSLMQLATNEQEVAVRVLAPSAAIVGACAVALRTADGVVVGTHNVPADAIRDPEHGGPDMLELPIPGGSLLVWTTPYAPFFGDEELRLLRTLGGLTGLALDRARLFGQERQMRLALEQADELKTTFVALAAHELRTPVASVNGLAQTLARMRDRLAPEQRAELENVLVAQTERLALLAEQLLDLSRLEAHAIEITPEPFRLRSRVEEIVETAAGEKADLVEVEVDERLEALADPSAFDRIVSNLITNALRYGDPPVVVRATRSDNHLHVAVEDHGPGVPPEFVSNLFERFTRSKQTRHRASGSGLGLAIARAYAQAHRGDLFYEPAEPSGARFKLVLPAEPVAAGNGRPPQSA
jgi:signal transduction histidine kinase